MWVVVRQDSHKNRASGSRKTEAAEGELGCSLRLWASLSRQVGQGA